MSGLTLYASSDLRALADHFAAQQGTTSDPLERRTIVVPNILVGQWFEQEIARLTGRPGRDDGVAANLDSIFLRGLVGRLLYRDDAAMDQWMGEALAVELYDLDRDLSLSDALRRGDALARLVTLRGDELDDYLTGSDYASERELLAARERAGRRTPRAQFEHQGVGRRGAGERLTLFGCLESPVGSLGPEVVRAVADGLDVDLYVAVASRELLDVDVAAVAPEERSLLERWGAPSHAHLALWMKYARPDRVEWLDGSSAWDAEKRAVVDATGARGERREETRTTPFVEIHGTVGLAREVEVARDALLAAMDELGVTPHEVRVVAANPQAVVPLLATYWRPSVVEEDGSPRLQYEVADPRVPRRSARVDAFVRLLRSVDAHLTPHDVAALLGEPSLLAGLDLTRADAERILHLAREGRVSLGRDAGDPARAGVFDADDDTGSWRRLVDRVALASCLEPADDAEVIAAIGAPDDLAAITRLGVLVELLAGASTFAREPRALREWSEEFAKWARVVERDERVRDPSLEGLLSKVADLGATSTRSVGFAEVRDLVEALTARTRGSSLFGRGGVSVLDAVGSSNIPYAITCVLGLDDELLPEPTRRVSELGEARASDPDPRAQFRQALLELLVSTDHRVLVFTSDRRVVDGSVLPTSLPLVELVEALAAAEPRGLVATERSHPRYGFSPPGSGATDVVPAGSATAPFSLDPVHAASANQLVQRRSPEPEDDVPIFTVTDPVAPHELSLDVEELVRFFRYPQRVFLRDVFSSARISDPDQRERPDVPYLDAGDALALYPLRERLLRRAVEIGVDPRVPEGPDSRVASVATGYRARASVALEVDELGRFARFVRQSLADAHATRADTGRRPAVVAGPARSISRPPVELLDTNVGPVLFEYTPSRSYPSRLIGLVVRQALLTVEIGEAVSAVLARSATTTETQHPLDRPYLVSTWRATDAVDGARDLLDRLIELYERRFERVPLHQNATTLATDASPAARAGVVREPAVEWLQRDWTGGADRGESTTPENRLMLPLTFAELSVIFDAQFSTQSAELTRALRGLEFAAVLGEESWVSFLTSRKGATSD
jgi:hypothetical protein